MKRWIVDTGVTNHMAPEKDFSINYSVVKGSHRVTAAGGRTLPVQGVDNVQLEHLGILTGVLHVQGLHAHLKSLQQLVSDTG